MAESFEVKVFGESWPWQWNPTTGLFSSSSPCCSSGFINNDNIELGGFGFFNPEFLDSKAWLSSDESADSPSEDMHMNTRPDNSSIDTSSMNPTLLHGNGSYHGRVMQQEDQTMEGCPKLQKNWNNFENPTINSFETVNHDHNFSLHHKPLINSLSNTNTGPYDYSSDLLLLNDYHQANLNEFSRNSLTGLSSSIEKQNPTNVAAPNHGTRPSLPSFKAMNPNNEMEDLGTVAKKSISETTIKRPRIETPTPLPTFKVRKEKMGDRITALQQLVSPFGKTDTASVLHEAIEYVKFLHDQVNVLSIPYHKNGAPIQRLQIKSNKLKEKEPKQDLKSRGLCLVPISSTFPITAVNTTDFWVPTFGGTF